MFRTFRCGKILFYLFHSFWSYESDHRNRPWVWVIVEEEIYNGHLIKIPNIFRTLSLLQHISWGWVVENLRLVDGVKTYKTSEWVSEMKIWRARNFARQYLFFRYDKNIFVFIHMIGWKGFWSLFSRIKKKPKLNVFKCTLRSIRMLFQTCKTSVAHWKNNIYIRKWEAKHIFLLFATEAWVVKPSIRKENFQASSFF